MIEFENYKLSQEQMKKILGGGSCTATADCTDGRTISCNGQSKKGPGLCVGSDQTVSSAGYKGGVVSCNWGDKITTIKCGIPQA